MSRILQATGGYLAAGGELVPGGLASAERPVALFCNGLGDHLLTLPAIRAMAHIFPGRLRLACLPGSRELFYSDLPLGPVHTI